MRSVWVPRAVTNAARGAPLPKEPWAAFARKGEWAHSRRRSSDGTGGRGDETKKRRGIRIPPPRERHKIKLANRQPYKETVRAHDSEGSSKRFKIGKQERVGYISEKKPWAALTAAIVTQAARSGSTPTDTFAPCGLRTQLRAARTNMIVNGSHSVPMPNVRSQTREMILASA
eukprot:6201483-Pleurochrysis_carterae.AAC.2